MQEKRHNNVSRCRGMTLLRNLTFNRSAHCTQVSDQCPLGLLFLSTHHTATPTPTAGLYGIISPDIYFVPVC